MKKTRRFVPARLVPKMAEIAREYSREAFRADLVAGLTVGLVALPLAMAFAIASGVKPEVGIYTAIVAGVVVSTVGGSRFQIAGPTGAFVVIVAGIVARFGVPGLLECTLMTGAILLVTGLTGLGAAVQYIPRDSRCRIGCPRGREADASRTAQSRYASSRCHGGGVPQ